MFFKNKKAISPLIAAVLLIAFTMTIAGLMAAWAQNYIVGRTQTMTEQSEEIEKCSKADFTLESGTRKTNSTVYIVIYNSGDLDFTDMNVFLSYSNSTAGPVIQSVKNAANQTIPVGELVSFSVTNNQTAVGMPLTKIKVVSVDCSNVYREKTFS